MRSGSKITFPLDGSFETRCDAMLLGRLGHEIAHIYHDTLHAPLPAGLRSLIDRLEAALDQGESHQPEPAMVRQNPRR